MMKKFISFVVVTAILFNTFVVFAQSNIVENVTYENNKYQLIDKEMTWTEAKAYCESLGGHLATFTSEGEWKAIHSAVITNKKQYWLGARDSEKEGEWKWVTGEQWSYEDWCKNEPNNDYGGTEDYLGTYTSTYQWNDYVETTKLNVICEWDNYQSNNTSTINNNTDVLKFEMREKKFEKKTSNGVVFYTRDYKYPYFLGNSGVENQWNEKMDLIIKGSEDEYKSYTQSELDSEYKDTLEWVSSSALPLYDNMEAEVTYNKNGYFSVLVMKEMWGGGAHVYYNTEGYIYDVENNKSLQYNDILNGSDKEIFNSFAYESEKAYHLNPNIDVQDDIVYDEYFFNSAVILDDKGVSLYLDVGGASPKLILTVPYEKENLFKIKNINSYSGNSIDQNNSYNNTKKITVILNGDELSFDVAPYIENRTTMVPMRTIFEALEAKIHYNGETSTVTAFRNDSVIKHTIGSEFIEVDNVIKSTLAQSKIVNESTMVPVRAISEAFGANVKWDDNIKTVTITLDNNIDPETKINDSNKLMALTCAESNAYKYMKKDFRNPAALITENANIKSSEAYQGINDFLDVFSLDYSPTNYYEVVLMDMLNKRDDYFETYRAVSENDLVKETFNQINDNLMKGNISDFAEASGLDAFDIDGFYDATIIDALFVANDTTWAYYDKFMQLYSLSMITDEKITAINSIKKYSSNKELIEACDNVIYAINEASKKTVEQMVAEGAFAGSFEMCQFVVQRGWETLIDIIPGMTQAKAIVSGGKIVSNNLYNADKISNDMLTMAATAEINDVVNKAMVNYELNYMSNNNAVNAKNFIATAKFYMDINKYGCDLVIDFTDDVEFAHDVQTAFDKVKYIFPVVTPLTDINKIISKNYNGQNVTQLRKSVSEISKTLNSDNYDFFKTFVVLP